MTTRIEITVDGIERLDQVKKLVEIAEALNVPDNARVLASFNKISVSTVLAQIVVPFVDEDEEPES